MTGATDGGFGAGRVLTCRVTSSVRLEVANRSPTSSQVEVITLDRPMYRDNIAECYGRHARNPVVHSRATVRVGRHVRE